MLLPTYAKFLYVALGHHCSTVTGQVENISPGCREAEAWEPTAGVPARLPRNLPTGNHWNPKGNFSFWQFSPHITLCLFYNLYQLIPRQEPHRESETQRQSETGSRTAEGRSRLCVVVLNLICPLASPTPTRAPSAKCSLPWKNWLTKGPVSPHRRVELKGSVKYSNWDLLESGLFISGGFVWQKQRCSKLDKWEGFRDQLLGKPTSKKRIKS